MNVRNSPDRMCAGQVRSLCRFGSKYEAPELGVTDVVAALAVVAANVRENHVSRICARGAGSRMETMAYNSLCPGLRAIRILCTLLLIARGSAYLRLSSFVGLEDDFLGRGARGAPRSGDPSRRISDESVGDAVE